MVSGRKQPNNYSKFFGRRVNGKGMIVSYAIALHMYNAHARAEQSSSSGVYGKGFIMLNRKRNNNNKKTNVIDTKKCYFF